MLRQIGGDPHNRTQFLPLFLAYISYYASVTSIVKLALVAQALKPI